MNNIIEINKLIKIINLLLFITTIIFYYINDFSNLVNFNSLFLYIILFLEINYFLKKNYVLKSPFITILCFVLIFFYLTRLVTINYYDSYDHSDVLNRLIPADVNDLNFSLIFIIFANLMIFLGIYHGEKNKPNIKMASTLESNKKSNVERVYYLSLLFLFNFVLNYEINYDNWFFELFSYVISPSQVIMVSIIIFIIYENSPFKMVYYYRNLIFLNIVLYAVTLFLLGSRSGLMSVILMFFFGFLACNKSLLKIKYMVFFIAFAFASFHLYNIATYLRYVKNSTGQFQYSSGLSIGIDYYLNNNADFIQKFGPAFDRISYLDFTIDAIKNSDEYSKVVNMPNEIYSIIDGLTPGFDVFNAPKVANALSAIYFDEPARLDRINSETYQSDQMGVYGEFYILFYKWLSLPIFSIFSYFFVRIYNKNPFEDFFSASVWRVFILSCFYQWLISFGLDWLVIYSILNLISIGIVLLIINSRFRSN